MTPRCLALNDMRSCPNGYAWQAVIYARVAIDSEGSIVGYTVAWPTFIKDSYKIGPLFADSEAVAEKLLTAVFEELLRQENPAPVVCIDAPTEKATKLCERLQGKRSFKLVYMFW